MVDYGMICDRLLRHSCRILMTLGLLVTASLGLGAEQRLPDAAKTARPHLPENDIKRFCLNNAAAAGDARIAFQTSKLHELEKEISQRLAELDSKTAELAEWMRRREEAMNKATRTLVAIYAQMKPAAAAQNLSAMENTMAAAIVAKLPARAASAILSEMEPSRAAQLTSGVASQEEKREAASQDGKKS